VVTARRRPANARADMGPLPVSKNAPARASSSATGHRPTNGSYCCKGARSPRSALEFDAVSELRGHTHLPRCGHPLLPPSAPNARPCTRVGARTRAESGHSERLGGSTELRCTCTRLEPGKVICEAASGRVVATGQGCSVQMGSRPRRTWAPPPTRNCASGSVDAVEPLSIGRRAAPGFMASPAVWCG
jgi:hypothetical protein